MNVQQISKVSGTPNLAVKDATRPNSNGQLNCHAGTLAKKLDFRKVENQLLG